tara:strand:- start:566 stop:685 length:120 start_codon:yes stop_codon:yes gene_type:complete
MSAEQNKTLFVELLRCISFKLFIDFENFIKIGTAIRSAN